MHKEDTHTYFILKKQTETSGVTTLYLAPIDGERPAFVSGQFITVYFPELGTAEGKAYSISSAPDDENLSITVKDIGAFSHKLVSLAEGDTLTASGPYGFFYSEETETPLVLLAGGIGVAPFKSIVTDVLRKNPSRKISLYYSVKEYPDAVFLQTFSALRHAHPNFTYTIHLTKGTTANPDCRAGRISIDRIAHTHKQDQEAEYFLCGSIPFVRDMWKGLRQYNIPEERLYTEAFFS